MSNPTLLLDVVPMRDQAAEHGVPAMVELEANPDLAPFLVSSTRSVVWIEELSYEGFLRAASRTIEGLQEEIVVAIAERSLEEGWGNVYSLSEASLSKCVMALKKAGVEEWEIMASPSVVEVVKAWMPSQEDQIHPVQWMPHKTLVVVPKDRSLLGTYGTFGDNIVVSVVHSARHGIGILFEDEDVADDGTPSVESE